MQWRSAALESTRLHLSQPMQRLIGSAHTKLEKNTALPLAYQYVGFSYR